MMWIFPSKAMFLGLCYYGDGNFLYLVTFSSHCKTLKGNEIYIPWSKVITETLVATSDPSSSVLATYPYIRFVDYQFLVDYRNYMISNHIHPNGWLNFHLFFLVDAIMFVGLSLHLRARTSPHFGWSSHVCFWRLSGHETLLARKSSNYMDL